MKRSKTQRNGKVANSDLEVKTTLGEFIRSTRKAKRMTIADLARRSNITHPFLSDVERGRRNPSEEVVSKLAENLGLSIEQLNELNTAAALRDFKQLLENDRDLRIAFTHTIRAVKQGKTTVALLKERLSL